MRLQPLAGPLEDFLDQPIPTEVWHYTSLEGLRGILSLGRVWATEARFTNDTTEFIHARDIAMGHLKAAARTDEHAIFAIDTASKLVEGLFDGGALSAEVTEVYIASFSAAKDLKSQWADYGDRHKGISIAFDLRGIRPPKGSGVGVTFAPCVYRDEEKDSLISIALGHFLDQTAENHRRVTSKAWISAQIKGWLMIQRIMGSANFDRAKFQTEIENGIHDDIVQSTVRTAFDLLRLASHCKDSKFTEENEWRLALPRTAGNAASSLKIRHRGKNHSIPYVESDLFHKGDRLPITRVMLGPLCTERQEIEQLLAQHGYEVQVVSSKIPLRASG